MYSKNRLNCPNMKKEERKMKQKQDDKKEGKKKAEMEGAAVLST